MTYYLLLSTRDRDTIARIARFNFKSRTLFQPTLMPTYLSPAELDTRYLPSIPCV